MFTNYEPKEFFQFTVTTKSIINADLNFQFTKVQPKNTNKLIKSTLKPLSYHHEIIQYTDGIFQNKNMAKPSSTKSNFTINDNHTLDLYFQNTTKVIQTEFFSNTILSTDKFCLILLIVFLIFILICLDYFFTKIRMLK